MTEDELMELIATEAEEINADMIRRESSPTTFVLAIASMVIGIHPSLDRIGNEPELDQFCRDYVDEVLANVLRERGWTIIRPGLMN